MFLLGRRKEQHRQLEMALFFKDTFGKIGQKNNLILLKWHKMGEQRTAEQGLDRCRSPCVQGMGCCFPVYLLISTDQRCPEVGILECSPCDIWTALLADISLFLCWQETPPPQTFNKFLLKGYIGWRSRETEKIGKLT